MKDKVKQFFVRLKKSSIWFWPQVFLVAFNITASIVLKSNHNFVPNLIAAAIFSLLAVRQWYSDNIKMGI